MEYVENKENLLNDVKKKKIDEFFDEVGYSRYHYFLLFIMILVFFADGTEVLVISLILKSLEKEWQLTPLGKSFVASSAFIGLTIGSFVASRLLDIYGRKLFLLSGGIVVLIFGYLSSLATNSFELFIFRVLMGIGIGAQIPAATNLAAESIPNYNRSIYLANLWIAFPMGELYVCIVSMYIMPNFETDKWRVVLLYCLIPVIICFIGSFFLYESTRYYLAYGKIKEANEVFYKLAKWGRIELKQKTLDEIVTEASNNPLNKYESNYTILISKRFLNLSLTTWAIWFISSIGLYTTVYMLPQILSQVNPKSISTNSNVFQNIIISNLIAMPKTIVGGLIPQIKILGRKYSTLISCALTTFFTFLVLIDVDHIFIYGGFIKLLCGISMAIIKIYSTEAYPTKIRGLGYGTGHSIARFAGMLVPFLSEGAIYISGLLAPFFIVFLFSAFSIYSAYSLPFETLGRTLDTVEKEDLIELKEAKDF